MPVFFQFLRRLLYSGFYPIQISRKLLHIVKSTPDLCDTLFTMNELDEILKVQIKNTVPRPNIS